MDTKVCNVCGDEKYLKDFKRDNRLRGGRSGTCKACANEGQRAYLGTGLQPVPEGWVRGCAECHQVPDNWYPPTQLCEHQKASSWPRAGSP